MIAEEVVRIDVDLFDDAAQSQLHDTPIVSGRAAAASLPSIHPFAAVGVLVRNEDSATGLQEIFLLREELVVREERDAADAGRGQIDQTGGRGYVDESRGRSSFNCRDRCCRPTEKRAAERDISRPRQRS